jgi:uncharacterized protein (DUF934 family)
MSVIVTDTGFTDDSWAGGFAAPEEYFTGKCLDLPPDADPEALRDVALAAPAIRVRFGSFADGRGFTIAARLRRMGYAGRLRAAGHVLADQYAMARRAGFDEVEIDADLAARQPEPQWLARANWSAHDYQSRLRG